MILKVLKSDEAEILQRVADGVFDFPIRPELAQEFLSDPRHHIAVAIDEGVVIGFASGVNYIHPDKLAELFVNEVGVASTHRNRGIGSRLVECLLDHSRKLGCRAAWVLTDDGNLPARRMYAKAGGLDVPDLQRLVAFHLEPRLD